MTDPRAAYARAGVDVAAGERAVELMRASVASTRRPEVLGGLGGFGSAVAIPAGYREPVIVSSTDGVGTKTAIAAAMGRLDTIGIDLVAMCADDVACTGAEPLAFLDYIAIGRLDPERVAALVAGIAEGCRQAGAALTGGETAEHPGLMEPDAFDLAGFCIGVGERSRLLDGTAARAGDAIVGLASSGLHANGYSLVRALVAEHGLAMDEPYGDLVRRTLGDAAGRLGVEPELVGAHPGRRAADADADLRAGPARDPGGPRGGRPRGPRHGPHHGWRPAGQRARGRCRSTSGHASTPRRWPMPSIMRVLGALGGIAEPELRATFNGGLGMVVVVPAGAAAATMALARARRIPAWVVGEVVEAASIGGRYVEEGSAR